MVGKVQAKRLEGNARRTCRLVAVLWLVERHSSSHNKAISLHTPQPVTKRVPRDAHVQPYKGSQPLHGRRLQNVGPEALNLYLG